MSDLSVEARSSPKWLEIVWYPTDHPPKWRPWDHEGWPDERRDVDDRGQRRRTSPNGDDRDRGPETTRKGGFGNRRWRPSQGRRSGRFHYTGSVVFDSIRLSDTVDEISNRAASQAFLDLEFEHGIYLETVVTDRTETTEAGEFVFDDGTAIPYSFEVISEEKAIYTLDGQEFKMGGGW